MKKNASVLRLYQGFLLLLSVVNPLAGFGQLNPALDVQHYRFSLFLNDTNNIIQGDAFITIKFNQNAKEVSLDLVKKRLNGRGMTVTQVTKNGGTAQFSQDSNHLIIYDEVSTGTTKSYKIKYHGEPYDGLFISKNKFGDRTFFGDNWPQRAHQWLPCNDHVSDKASVEFLVTAPDHYQVVGNGLKIEETNLGNNLKFTHWKEDEALPPKIMAIGVARFAVYYIGDVEGIPIYSWLFPQDRDPGFAHYSRAKEILPWYIQHVGAYPYKKLANVEAITVFGGMENANAIFYSEPSVNLPGIEALMAHEIAHQWFGNSASEKDWPHVWLSEGFATYMTHLYHESKYGVDSFNNRMRTDRDTVISFSKIRHTPIVDFTATTKLFDLLNNNSYEKGAWILHMLRRKVGDTLFWQAIRKYYKTYAGSNADTHDLERVFTSISHQNLTGFFNQWCYNSGQPTLTIQWSYNNINKSVSIKVEQLQKNMFQFPLKLKVAGTSEALTKTIDINKKVTLISFPFGSDPVDLIVDPNVSLLFEARTSRVKELKK